MDTLSIIMSKAERLAELLPESGILSVVRHIEVAERHYTTGRQEEESDLFDDVIYRTNHAFEGILRESYTILAEQESANVQAYAIEQYLAENSIFEERVMELFTNYRRKWRNPSTHDHVGTFTESEAFLAILSVTAFVGMLMDQMVERLVFDQQELQLAEQADQLRQGLDDHRGEPLFDRVVYLLQTFAGSESATAGKNELELLASLRAYVHTAAPNIIVTHEPLLSDDFGTLHPDLLLREGEDVAVVEVKRLRRWSGPQRRSAMDQLKRYVTAANAIGGVVLITPPPNARESEPEHIHVVVETLGADRMLTAIHVAPKGAA
ncbi:MAG: hypothetical protein GY719_35680 [bacterium]|nr:hypothetical protein [bacterium]